MMHGNTMKFNKHPKDQNLQQQFNPFYDVEYTGVDKFKHAPGYLSEKTAIAIGIPNEKHPPPFYRYLLKEAIPPLYEEYLIPGRTSAIPKNYNEIEWIKEGYDKDKLIKTPAQIPEISDDDDVQMIAEQDFQVGCLDNKKNINEEPKGNIIVLSDNDDAL